VLELNIRLAEEADSSFLSTIDHHVSAEMLQRKIDLGEILIVVTDDELIGFLRWGWFWDEIPFMNLLFVRDSWRGRGVATRLIAHWEEQMLMRGAKWVLTSTLANERAQHLYRKCGYRDIGGFLMPDEPLELVLFKAL
jgi:predicted GNAT family acetyltransferase